MLRLITRTVCVVVLIVFMAGCSIPVKTDQTTHLANTVSWSQLHNAEIVHDDLPREYFFWNHEISRPDAPAPLVIALHGGGSHARNLMQRSSLSTLASKEGFVVVFPQGVAAVGSLFRTWNAGVCCGPAVKKNIDDIGFVRSVITQMVTEHDIDPERIYVTGFSNGGLLAYRLACELSDVITAISPVAAVMTNTGTCVPASKVAVIAFHGRKDKRVKYAGDASTGRIKKTDTMDRDSTRRPRLSVAQSVQFWADLNSCSGKNRTTFEGFSIDEYAECRAAVKLFSIDELGHRWPGWDRRLLFGRRDPETSMRVIGSKEMWDFFNAHQRQIQ